MDSTRRQITKIAREVGKFTVRTMKAEGVGTAEFDLIHVVRKNPGITQTARRISLHTPLRSVPHKSVSHMKYSIYTLYFVFSSIHIGGKCCLPYICNELNGIYKFSRLSSGR